MTRAGRIPCVVVGCRRTAPKDRYPEGTQIICGKCFRLAPRHVIRRHRRLRRLLKKMRIEDAGIGDTKPGSKERQAWLLFDRSWRRIVRQATEARMGIG